jgi:acetolactate synthase I/II/III large subunit
MNTDSILTTGCLELGNALANARRPLLVLGYGAVLSRVSAEVARLTQRLPLLRIVATPKAKGVFPETHPLYLGVVGFAGHAEANRYLFETADYVVIVGSRLGELTSNNWDVRWQSVNSARIDIADVTASWCRSQLVIQGDARLILNTVQRGLPRNPGAATNHLRRLHLPVASLMGTAPLVPKDIMAHVNATFPADGHVFSGIGNTMAWAVHYLRRTRPDRWHVNLCAGSMGHAIPAAIGAALTGAPALAVVGDAEFLMTGYELHTAVENQLNLIVVVLNDAGHGMVRVGSIAHCNGDTPSFDFHLPVDVVAASRAQGAFAVRVRQHATFAAEFVASLARSGPTVIDVPIAADLVPPLGARLDALSHAFGLGKESSADVAQ